MTAVTVCGSSGPRCGRRDRRHRRVGRGGRSAGREAVLSPGRPRPAFLPPLVSHHHQRTSHRVPRMPSHRRGSRSRTQHGMSDGSGRWRWSGWGWVFLQPGRCPADGAGDSPAPSGDTSRPAHRAGVSGHRPGHGIGASRWSNRRAARLRRRGGDRCRRRDDQDTTAPRGCGRPTSRGAGQAGVLRGSGP